MARSRVFGVAKRIFRRFGEIFAEVGFIEKPEDVFCLTFEEVFSVAKGQGSTKDLKSLAKARMEEFRACRTIHPPDRITANPLSLQRLPETAAGAGGQATATGAAAQAAEEEEETRRFTKGSRDVLKGIGCTSGRLRAPCAVIHDPAEATDITGKILVTRMTDPGWVFLMIASAGIIVEKGSILSHTAIIGREFGLPTIVSVENATKILRDGMEVEMDGSTGVIRVLR
jgi:pyruvate,water dikinase